MQIQWESQKNSNQTRMQIKKKDSMKNQCKSPIQSKQNPLKVQQKNNKNPETNRIQIR